MFNGKNKPLVLASLCTASATIAHLGCILFGGDWYRFFGAGEEMAILAEQGHWYPTVATSFITLLLSIWTMYGLSAAKVIRRLPLTRLALVLISMIFLSRGIMFTWLIPMFPENGLIFWLVSSGICLMIGLLFTLGTIQTWSQLSNQR
ncbi:MAG: hypothetical protein ACPGUD_06070 [Parashewanella sp.]